MGILDMAMNLATAKSSTIARVIGKPEREVKQAIGQAQKILPEVLNSSDGGISILKKLGVDKSFINDMYKKYGKYGSKIGLSQDTIDNAVNQIEKAVDNGNPRSATQSNSTTPKKSVGWDKDKYKKI